MDRFFSESEKQMSGSDLHLTGVVSMFIASKYEEVIPLLMKTIINKIGHNKFDIKSIEQRELEILTALGFKVGAPTVKEYLDKFTEELGNSSLKTEKFTKTCVTLAKLACHSYTLMQVPTSLLAGSIMSVAYQFHVKS